MLTQNSSHGRLTQKISKRGATRAKKFTSVYSLDNNIGSQKEYIEWLMKACTAKEVKISDLIEPSALDLLASFLKTPLQIEQHLMRSFDAAYHIGEKPVTKAVVESVLSTQINDIEPTLIRNGYNVKELAEQFGAKPSEIRAFFRGQLDQPRTRDLQQQILSAGLPL